MLVPARRGLVHLALVCSGRFESIRRRSATKAGWASFTITAELIGFAYAKQPLLTLVALLYGLQEAGDAMSDELWEFVSCSSAWPVANALVGLGTEVLIVCQIFGAVIEEKAFRHANLILAHLSRPRSTGVYQPRRTGLPNSHN